MEKKQWKLSNPKQKIAASIVLPASKSISNRLLIIHALNYSLQPINNLSGCEDTKYLNAALCSNTNKFYTGDGGTSLRFLTAYLSKIVGEWYIDCSERMKERPVRVLVEALNELGAQISYEEKEGYPPLKIFGSHLTKSELKLSASVSSQYISALLLIAPTLPEGLKIVLEGKVVSRPYIEMTLQLMEDFGIHSSFEENTIIIKAQTYKSFPFTVEADWTAASYWYELLYFAKEGQLFLEGVEKNSCQGDAQQVELWGKLGVRTIFKEKGVQLLKTSPTISRMEHDFSKMPDLAQTFAVSCAMKGVPFHFTGLETLKIKETNRIKALINELGKLGFELYEPEEGSLAWEGERKTISQQQETVIKTYRDHRMAMAFAPIILLEPIIIEDPEVVNKSYPNFWADLVGVLS